MLAETPQELCTFQCHYFLPVITVIAPAKTNTGFINVQYPVIADGYFVRVAPQVFNHLFRPGKGFLGVNYPVGFLQLPDELLILWQLFLQPCYEFGPEYGGKIFDPEKAETKEKIKKHKDRKAGYQDLRQQLEQSGETQISTSDPESRQLITRNNITEVGYSVQTTVDAKHNLPIDYKVTNQNDNKAMGGMVRRVKTILQSNDFTALYDKGYHTGGEFDYVDKQGVEVTVAIPDPGSHAPDPSFDIEHFVYDKLSDSYTCPAVQTLTTNGNQYDKNSSKSNYKVKHYKTNECQKCPFVRQCTRNKSGRILERSEYADLIHANKLRLDINKKLYLRRQAIVEHPYGIIKRQWGYGYIMTKKSMKRASADVGLIFVVYNLRRIMSILGQQKLKAYLKALFAVFCSIRAYFKALSHNNFFSLQKNLWKYAMLISKHLPNFNPVFSLNLAFE